MGVVVVKSVISGAEMMERCVSTEGVILQRGVVFTVKYQMLTMSLLIFILLFVSVWTIGYHACSIIA